VQESPASYSKLQANLLLAGLPERVHDAFDGGCAELVVQPSRDKVAVSAAETAICSVSRSRISPDEDDIRVFRESGAQGVFELFRVLSDFA